ncbi:MAG: hypothetical protein M3416_07535 [Acidobacteriota bacterium]|nr:hypothetical protein [Acidobacteriota bacterium]
MRRLLLTLALALTLTPAPASGQRPNPNLALGGTVTASSTYPGRDYDPKAVVDGDRKGLGWAAGGGWNDGTFGQFPDDISVEFEGGRPLVVSRVVVVGLQDDFNNPTEPFVGQNSPYALRDFDVQVRDQKTHHWRTVATVAGNTKVISEVTFAPERTAAVRVVVRASAHDFSCVVEVEAYRE